MRPRPVNEAGGGVEVFPSFFNPGKSFPGLTQSPTLHSIPSSPTFPPHFLSKSIPPLSSSFSGQAGSLYPCSIRMFWAMRTLVQLIKPERKVRRQEGWYLLLIEE